MRRYRLFTCSLSALLAFGVGLTQVAAQEHIALPDLGSSARASLPAYEASAYGASMLRQMRQMKRVLDDPLIDDYLNDLGYRLVAHSNDPRQEFTFFAVKDNDINAFAAPGGYIGVNAGLIGLTRSESELAAVMGHEIGHITQHHLERAFEAAKKDTPLAALVVLGAIAAGSAGNPSRPYGYSGTSEPADPAMGILAAGMGLLQQRRINFTRRDEVEADRMGIKTLAAAGFDTHAMATFFQRMQDQLGSGGDLPELLRTHPVTVNRIAAAKSYATSQSTTGTQTLAPISDDQWQKITAPSRYSIKRSTPAVNSVQAASSQRDSRAREQHYQLMRERVRALSLSPDQAIHYYQSLNQPDHAQQYGHALALSRYDRPQEAMRLLQTLNRELPNTLAIRLALADAMTRGNELAGALQIYHQLNQRAPRNRAIIGSWATALLREKSEQNGKQAAALIKPLLNQEQNPLLYHLYARANVMANNTFEAAEAAAHASYLEGRPFDAMEQLRRVLQDPDLDYYQRARIQSDIDELHPLLLELEKRHVETPDRPQNNR